MQFVKLVFVVSACLVARSAAAQPAAPGSPPQPALPNVLPTAAGGTLDARIDHSRFFDDSEFGAPMLFALNLHGQYIAPMGLGGYLSLPVAFVADDSDAAADLGNPELGGLYVHHGSDVDAYVRGGFAFGQLNTEEDGLLLLLANIAPRPADTITSAGGSIWLRGGAGLRLTSGALVAGVSGGVDLEMTDPEANLEGMLHASGSIGVAQPSFGLAVGATMLRLLVDEGDSDVVFGLQAVADAPLSARTRIYGALGTFLADGVDVLSVGIGLRVGL